jgi:hypothetical protein
MFNVGGYLGTTLSGCFENDLRLLFVAGDIVAFKQHAFERVINPRCPVDGLWAGDSLGI